MAHISAYASIVLVVGPDDQVALVIERTKPTPHYWKLPGGAGEEGEDPFITALRETEEETGLKILIHDLHHLVTVPKRNHDQHFFLATAPSFEYLAKRGVEGENVARFKLDEIMNMLDFFPPHRDVLSDQREELGKRGVVL